MRGPIRHKSLPVLGTMLALAAGPSAAAAASFDCTRASSRVETLICTDAQLGALDEQLARLYGRTRDGLAAADAQALTQEQRAWLAQRDQCETSLCVADAYRARIAYLGGGVGSAPSQDGSLPLSPDAAFGAERVERSDTSVTVTQAGPKIEMTASYPRLPGGGAETETANALVAELARTVLEDFRDEYRSFISGGDGGHMGPPWALELGFEQVFEATRFWAVDMTVYRYTGGAHGSMEHLPLVIARADGSLVDPAGLFRPGSDWLAALSEYCGQELSQKDYVRDDPDWLRRGTAPTAENYQDLLPLADGLHVIFEQYQIGPYAIGIHQVTVPYAALGELLSPELFSDLGGT